MSYPSSYTRQYDFQSYQNENPNRPLPGDKVNADLNLVQLSVGEVIDFLKIFTRSDGQIANAVVGRDQLSAQVLALIDAANGSEIPASQVTNDSGVSGATVAAALDALEASIVAGGISDIVQDTSPQLGGNLDLNGSTVGDATAADLTKLHALTATSAELNYVDGVTSAIQTQIDAKRGSATSREKLTANRTYYVRADGDDVDNDGLTDSAGGAFLTIPHALDVVYDTIDLAGFECVIQVGAGTYTDGYSNFGRASVGGIPTLRGDTTTPANVLISTTSESAFDLKRGVALYVEGLKVQTTTSGHCFHISNRAYLGITGAMNFGACAGTHLAADHESVIGIASNYTISGGAVQHWGVSNNADIEVVQGPPAITVSGTPAFSDAFAAADRNGSIESQATYSGSATGKIFEIASGGKISSTNTMPGNATGTYGDETFEDVFATGTLTVGSETPVPIGGFTTRIHAAGSNTSTSNISVSRFSADANPSRFLLAKSRSGTIGGNTIVQSGDTCGELSFFGNDGANMQQAAAIRGVVDGTPGTNDMPMKMDFLTADDGGTTLQVGLTIRQNQAVEFPAISTTGSAANAFLDSGASNNLLRSTSSLAYKKDVEPVGQGIADAFLKAVQPIWYRSLAKADKLDDGREKSFYSFGAEPLAEIDPRLVNWGYQDDAFDIVIDEEKIERVEGEGDEARIVVDTIGTKRRVLKEGARMVPDGVNDRAILAMLVSIVKKQDARIAELESRLA